MKHLLVAIDLPSPENLDAGLEPITGRVLDAARQLAIVLEAKVTLLHVADPDPEFVGYDAGPQTVRDHVAKELRQEHVMTQELAGALKVAGVEAMPLTVQGVAADTVLDHAKRLGVDLIIVGTHGRQGLARLFVGSVAQEVVKRARVPVVVVPMAHDDASE